VQRNTSCFKECQASGDVSTPDPLFRICAKVWKGFRDTVPTHTNVNHDLILPSLILKVTVDEDSTITCGSTSLSLAGFSAL